MVWSFVLLFTMSWTLWDRAFDTLHEALIIAGGSCLDMTCHDSTVLFSLILCPHSVEIHHSWPNQPIGNTG